MDVGCPGSSGRQGRLRVVHKGKHLSGKVTFGGRGARLSTVKCKWNIPELVDLTRGCQLVIPTSNTGNLRTCPS